MKQKKENRIALLLQWAGEQKIWLLLAILWPWQAACVSLSRISGFIA